jgi:hypothetical protein
MEAKGNMAFRFTSPILEEKDRVLYECPVSAVMKLAPHIYDVIPLHSYVSDSGSVDYLQLSPWAQRAVRVIGGEKGRLWDMARAEEKGHRDAQTALSVGRSHV